MLPDVKDTPVPQFVVPLLTKLVRHNEYPTGSELEFYANATHLAEWLMDGKTRRQLIDDVATRERKAIPVGEPDYQFSRAPLNSVSHMIGEAVLVRCTWPKRWEAPA